MADNELKKSDRGQILVILLQVIIVFVSCGISLIQPIELKSKG